MKVLDRKDILEFVPENSRELIVIRNTPLQFSNVEFEMMDWANGEKEYWYNGKEYDLIPPEIQKKRIEKLTPKKSSKQKRREDLLKEFVCEVLST